MAFLTVAKNTLGVFSFEYLKTPSKKEEHTRLGVLFGIRNPARCIVGHCSNAPEILLAVCKQNVPSLSRVQCNF